MKKGKKMLPNISWTGVSSHGKSRSRQGGKVVMSALSYDLSSLKGGAKKEGNRLEGAGWSRDYRECDRATRGEEKDDLGKKTKSTEGERQGRWRGGVPELYFFVDENSWRRQEKSTGGKTGRHASSLHLLARREKRTRKGKANITPKKKQTLLAWFGLGEIKKKEGAAHFSQHGRFHFQVRTRGNRVRTCDRLLQAGITIQKGKHGENRVSGRRGERGKWVKGGKRQRRESEMRRLPRMLSR